MFTLRNLLWIYLVLLIFEGALRKWIVPMLDAPLLIIRDPLVLWIYFEATRSRLTFNNAFFYPNLVLMVFTAGLSTVFGIGNPAITVYGIHTNFLQVPLIFLMPQILNRDDVIAMGRFILVVSLFMAVLVIYQFRAPQDSWVNKGAMNTWYGTVRPSGTFSFIAGLVSYFSLTSSFLLYGFLRVRTYQIWLLAAVTFALLIASACSGSRSCIVSIGVVTVAAVFCVIIRGKGGAGMLIAAVVIGLVVALLSTMPVFQTGEQQLIWRFQDGAANGEDTQGFVGRYGNTMFAPLMQMGNEPIFGNGLGLGTNAAAGMLTGEREFLGAEDEWGRIVFESGPIFGFLIIVFRVALTLAVGKQAYDALRDDNVLPILIFASCGLLMLNGQWGVPATLGFVIFGGGLTLAACVDPPEEEEHEDGEQTDHAEDEPDHSTAADSLESS